MKSTLLAVTLFGGILCGAISGIQVLEEWRCGQTWKDSGYQTRLNFGCQVRVDGKWVPASSIQIVARAAP